MTVRATVSLAAVSLLAWACGTPQPAQSPGPTASAAAAVTTAAAAHAGPGTAPVHEPSGDVEFKAALDLKQKPKGNEPQLRHGWIAASKDWPASLYVTFQTADGMAACTAALIGPQAMLTAAHCVPGTGKVTFVYAGQAQPYDTECTRHPRYPADASADFALCRIKKAFAAPAGFLFETVDSGALSGMQGASLILTGYGCVGDAVASAQFDDKYRIGFNKVDETSASAPPARHHDEAFYAPRENNNLFTADDPEAANLCPGDSGGPVFRRQTGAAVVTSRSIVGVNSRVFYRDAAHTTYGSSLLSSTGGPDFRGWASLWAKDNKVAACGIAGAVPNCRS